MEMMDRVSEQPVAILHPCLLDLEGVLRAVDQAVLIDIDTVQPLVVDIDRVSGDPLHRSGGKALAPTEERKKRKKNQDHTSAQSH